MLKDLKIKYIFDKINLSLCYFWLIKLLNSYKN